MALLLFLLKCILAILLLFATYLLFSFIGYLIPINRHFTNHQSGIEIHLSSDGIHTDFVVPAKNPLFDWSAFLTKGEFETSLSEHSFLAFGWGERGFYLDIPTWADLTPKVAMRAMLIPSATLMHIYSHEKPPSQSKYFKSIFISEEQYLDLCAYIQSYFKIEAGELVHLPEKNYTTDDQFYIANGSYHAFHTCNYWVNRGLKRIGVRTAFWSPSGKGIFHQLRLV